MNIGKLNRRVSLQVLKPMQDPGNGEPGHDWVEIAKPWANIRFLNGREFAAAGGEVSKATVSVRVRYRADVIASMRVVYRSAIYDIVAVLPDESGREFIDLACTTGATQG
jgi:SPP1 family predicted phage head-tail adaptor